MTELLTLLVVLGFIAVFIPAMFLVVNLVTPVIEYLTKPWEDYWRNKRKGKP